jgi:hypothetical protein
MRPVTLRTLVAGTAAAFALIPAGVASARPHPHVITHLKPGDGCRVSLFAEPHLVTSGESAQLFGVQSCRGLSPTIGQTVTIYQHVAGTGGFRVIGTTTSAAGGYYTFVAPTLPANSVFYAVVGGRRSAARTVRVAPVVTLNGPSQLAALLTGRRNGVTFTGTVDPAEEGGRIALQREDATSSEEWHTIQFGRVGPKGVFSITHHFAIPGDVNLRIAVRVRRGVNARGTSTALSYVISQPQNPALTINSSAPVAAYGQPVKITGVLAGGKGQTVALLSHARRQPPFTKVGETTTSSNGEYTFTLTALRSGPYKAMAPGVSSRTLFEGVRYLLSASASAAASPAGQPVTFSGTVTPVHTGHVVYLERENLAGGFHVADVGTVAADGTYSISHYMFGSGKQVYRIHVPGDPENMGTSSQTFPVQVTPPPPGSLRPLPQARQPLAGH